MDNKDHKTKRKSLLVRLQQKISVDEPIHKDKLRKVRNKLLNEQYDGLKDGFGDYREDL